MSGCASVGGSVTEYERVESELRRECVSWVVYAWVCVSGKVYGRAEGCIWECECVLASGRVYMGV